LERVGATELAGSVLGGRAPELQKHIKAVTYHDLAIRETGRGLEVTIVFDV
jgi:SHS2 domain-containing protein